MKKIVFIISFFSSCFSCAVQSGYQQLDNNSKPIYLWVDARSEKDFRIARQALRTYLEKPLSRDKTRQMHIYCGMAMSVYDVKYQTVKQIIDGILTNSRNVVRSVEFADDGILVTETFQHDSL